MLNYLFHTKQFIPVYLILTIFLSNFIGCADWSSNPDEINSTPKKINIYTPSNNSRMSIGTQEIIYSVEVPYSLRFIELYINGTFKRNYPPNQDGTAPQVLYDFDSSYVGKEISIYLVYYDNNGTSDKSNIVSPVLITIDNRVPFQPYGLSIINFHNGTLNLSWKDSSQYVEKYEIWKKTNISGEYTLFQEVSGNSNNINDYNIDSTLIYFYKVRGIKSSGASPFSSEVNTEGVYTSGDLNPPSNLNGYLAGQQVVQLSWTDNSDNENYFAIERSLDNVDFNRIAAVSQNITMYKDSANGLVVGFTYYYRIKAYSNSDSAYSNIFQIRVSNGVLNPPSNLTADNNSTAGVVELNWINNDNTTLYFEIERKLEGGNYQLIKTIEANTTLYLDFTTEKNKTYSYRVRGSNSNIYSGYSNEVTILTN